MKIVRLEGKKEGVKVLIGVMMVPSAGTERGIDGATGRKEEGVELVDAGIKRDREDVTGSREEVRKNMES